MSNVVRPDFLEAYNAVVVPEPLVSMDAIDEHVHATADRFFAEVRTALDLGSHTVATFFEIEDKMLVTPHGPEKEVRGSDDFMHLFQRRGGQAIASVLYQRDSFNFQIAQFAKYPLLPRTIEEIREFQRLEQIIHGLE